MNLRIVGATGNVLGILVLPATLLLADLEALRRLGARKVELLSAKTAEAPLD
jgi:hypothetical protein